MTGREVRVERLVGRRVHAVDGRVVGRIEDMHCEVVLHARGRDYVVRTFCIGRFGWLDAFAGSILSRELLKMVGRVFGYRALRIGWERLDLTDPSRPLLRGD